MTCLRSRDFLTRRIDRCYLIAAAAKAPDKRAQHLELARHYREVLTHSVEAGHETFMLSEQR
ncbi:MAG: hypothetical protein KGJ57_21965 [Sphingomonadales bacterium]|nr:hypothetical protein [Sphingomonadales bacterium]MDE2172056.1 hypothetical protein [Sphingomonadales bacterium]